MIVLKSALPHDKVFEWLDSIYIQPSRTEGLPRALLEAMSRGLPTTGIATGEIPLSLDTYMVFSNSKENVSEICAIFQMLLDSQLREEQTKRNFAFCEQYPKAVLDKKRNEFYAMIKEECNS